MKTFALFFVLSASLAAQKVDLKPEDAAALLRISATRYQLMADYTTAQADLALIPPAQTAAAAATSKRLAMDLADARIAELGAQFNVKVMELRKTYNCPGCTLNSNMEFIKPSVPVPAQLPPAKPEKK